MLLEELVQKNVIPVLNGIKFELKEEGFNING